MDGTMNGNITKMVAINDVGNMTMAVEVARRAVEEVTLVEV